MMFDLRNIDCMEMMSEFSDHHFDLAIVDPPYGLGGQGFTSTAKKELGGRTNNANLKFEQVDRKYGTHKTDLGGIPTSEYFKELFRVSKHQIIWGMQFFVENLSRTNCVIVWDKKNGTNKFSDVELAWTSFPTATRLVSRFNEPSGEFRTGRIHPTQKPIKLYEWILKQYASEGFKIFDSHLGSASIAIACENMNKIEGMNLTLTGAEINPFYFQKAMKRIKQHSVVQKINFNAN